jgi:hypothetical protein
MKKLRKAGVLALLMALTFTLTASAQSTTTTSVTSMQSLLQQIKTLQDQINSLRQQQLTLSLQISQNLQSGMTSDEVKALQAALAADPEIYPEGIVSGFFGSLTEKAVRKFQEKNGLEQVGVVGPRTRQLLNKLLSDKKVNLEEDEGDDDGDGDRKERVACVPPGHLIAPGWLKQNREGKNPVRPCKALPRGIEKKLGEYGSSTASTTDTTAPTIYRVEVSTGDDQAEIEFRTSEVTTARISWQASSTTSTLDDSIFRREHSFLLTNLNASTTYSYSLVAKDKTGNTSTSTSGSFTTDGDDEDDEDDDDN